MPSSADALIVSAPASSANLGPGFDTLAVALDLSNAVVVTQRPGPLEVRVVGECEGELPENGTNLVCEAIAEGLGDLDGLSIECRNRIPLGRGLGSSAAAVCAGLVAANALGRLRWSPDEILARAAQLEGHADNAAACLTGGLVAVTPGPQVRVLGPPEDLAFVVAVPSVRVSTDDARGALPDGVPLPVVATTLSRAVGLTLALADGRLEDLPPLLADDVHEPSRQALVPGIGEMRALSGEGGCLGVTISGSGPSALLWCRVEDADELAVRATAALERAGIDSEVKVRRPSATGVRARWGGSEASRLAKAVG